jgi:hypothetical protein
MRWDPDETKSTYGRSRVLANDIQSRPTEAWELFYRERNRMMVVDVKTAPSFTASIPRPLFDLKGRFREEFDVTPDGQRFILVHELEDEPPTEIRVGFGLLLPRRGSPQP